MTEESSSTIDRRRRPDVNAFLLGLRLVEVRFMGFHRHPTDIWENAYRLSRNQRGMKWEPTVMRIHTRVNLFWERELAPVDAMDATSSTFIWYPDYATNG